MDAQGYGKAETDVQAETLTTALEAQSCRAVALAVAVTAAAEAGSSGGSGDSGLRYGRENVK